MTQTPTNVLFRTGIIESEGGAGNAAGTGW